MPWGNFKKFQSSSIKFSFFQVGTTYLLGILLLTIYGVEVCPYIDNLPFHIVALIITGSFTLALVLKFLLFPKVLKVNDLGNESYVSTWPLLFAELSVWFLASIFTTIWNSIFYEFPVGSGLKVVLGSLTLGFFSATYLALKHEEVLILLRSKMKETNQGALGGYFSITAKFQTFSIVSYSVIVGIILLLISKDLKYLVEEENLFRAVAIEIVFVFTIVFLGSVLILRQYSKNLNLSFKLQLLALDEVSKGNYDVNIPIVSNDELSLIAHHSKQMLQGLKEKERVQHIFNKYMSPDVANAILSQESGDQLGGKEVQVAVLFTDLRNYTGLSEQLSPKELVSLLNEYFSLVVKHVHHHHGVLDKFIGDAAMAVFGLGTDKNAALSAITCAQDIRKSLKVFNNKLEAEGRPTIGNGIGIHYGTVVAGNIGASERLEYTIIGDTVNVASRLESLTKQLDCPIVFSSSVLKQLPAKTQNIISALGEQQLKGKSEVLAVYGLYDG